MDMATERITVSQSFGHVSALLGKNTYGLKIFR